MSDDPLDETIRGTSNGEFTWHDTATALRDGTELVLVKAATYIHPATLDELKRVGWGTCHMQGPDGKLRLVSVSIVSPQIDPWEADLRQEVLAHEQELNRMWQGAAQDDRERINDVMFQRAKAMSNELFGSDARGKIIHDGEGNLIVDDVNAMQPEETARREMYASWPDDPEFRAAYRKTLMGQYEELQDATHSMGRVLMQDLRDLWAIVRGWFGRK